MEAAQTIIGPPVPVHAFRFVRESIEHLALPPNRILIFWAFQSPL